MGGEHRKTWRPGSGIAAAAGVAPRASSGASKLQASAATAPARWAIPPRHRRTPWGALMALRPGVTRSWSSADVSRPGRHLRTGQRAGRLPATVSRHRGHRAIWTTGALPGASRWSGLTGKPCSLTSSAVIMVHTPPRPILRGRAHTDPLRSRVVGRADARRLDSARCPCGRPACAREEADEAAEMASTGEAGTEPPDDGGVRSTPVLAED